jgi:hypothetical protein
MRSFLTLAAIVACANAGGSVELTATNFEAESGGKNSFVKFQAPW